VGGFVLQTKNFTYLIDADVFVFLHDINKTVNGFHRQFSSIKNCARLIAKLVTARLAFIAVHAFQPIVQFAITSRALSHTSSNIYFS